MFGFFGEKNNKKELDDKYSEIATLVTFLLTSGGVGIKDHGAGLQVTKEGTARIKGNDLLKCKTNVVALFVMTATGDSAFRDGDKSLALLICNSCKSLATQIMSVSPGSYSDLEFTMVRNSLEFMKNIDSSIEIR